MVISLAVSVCGKFKSLCVCPSLRMHVSIRFWQLASISCVFLFCFLFRFLFMVPGCTGICNAIGGRDRCQWRMSSCLHGDRPGRERCTVRTHQIIGGSDKHVLVLLTIDALGCAFLRVQDACVNFCPLFYDRSFPMAF